MVVVSRAFARGGATSHIVSLIVVVCEAYHFVGNRLAFSMSALDVLVGGSYPRIHRIHRHPEGKPSHYALVSMYNTIVFILQSVFYALSTATVAPSTTHHIVF